MAIGFWCQIFFVNFCNLFIFLQYFVIFEYILLSLHDKNVRQNRNLYTKKLQINKSVKLCHPELVSESYIFRMTEMLIL